MRLQNHQTPHINEPGCNGIGERKASVLAKAGPSRFHRTSGPVSPFDTTRELSFWRLFQVLQPSSSMSQQR